MKTCFTFAAALSLSLTSPAFAADAPAKKPADPTKAKAAAPKKAAAVVVQPKPTAANVPYGKHERQVLDFWKAESAAPTPLLFYIHGGGWQGGDKNRTGFIEKYLAAGISVVAINYRFIPQATADGVVPPVKGPLHDAARALQFVRSKSAEWNIDKQRIGASGGSAGACSSLWLAFHPDMADPKSSDPIARESTRLWCAAVSGAQTTLDPQQMKEWTPNSKYGGHAFGFKGDAEKKLSQFDEFLAKRDTIMPWIAEYSPYALVTSDDPPIYLSFAAPPAPGQEQKDPTHTANFGVKLQENCKKNGVTCELVYPGTPNVKHPTTQDYLIATLKAPKRK
jgi:acetyl esterase/lipase